MGFPCTPAGLSEAERDPLKQRANSATLDAQSPATGLGRDPDRRRNVPNAPLLAQQPKVPENNSAAGEKHAKIYIC